MARTTPVVTNDSGNTPVRGMLSVWGNVGTTGDDLTPGARWMGNHDGGAPTAGAFQAGDFVIDKTTPALWICTVSGTPGTWVSIT